MMNAKNGQMTKVDRESLLKVMRERVTKSSLAEADAQLLADLEKQMDAEYYYDLDKIWKESLSISLEAAKQAQQQVHERCRELEIPYMFAPQIRGPDWCPFGEQAVRVRPDVLSKMALLKVDAMAKASRRKVEEASLDIQTKILASGLSPEAPEQLMRLLVLDKLETMLREMESTAPPEMAGFFLLRGEL
jgi:hypothetical protein